MTVSGLTMPNDWAANWTSGTIPAGVTQPVVITFSPTAVQSYDGTLTVDADQTSGTNTIGVSGAGVSPNPNVPTLISPANGAVLPQGPLGSRPTWTFSWSAVPGTNAYRLYVRRQEAPGPLVDIAGIATTTYGWVTDATFIDANLQDWQWMVQSDQGWSQFGTFSIAPAGSTIAVLAVSSLISFGVRPPM